jgi:DNA modification methylase
MICGGHGRKKILERLGIKEVDCYIPSRKLTQKEFDELNIRLNKNIAGEFNFDVLANEFDLQDLLEWGFEEKELDLSLWNEIPEEKLDEVPEVQKVAVSKLGDLFLLDGKHRVLCGSSTDVENVKTLMGGGIADMVFTDVPYGIDYSGGRTQTVAKKDYGKIKGDVNQDISLFVAIINSNGYKRDAYICVSPINLKPVFSVLDKYDAVIVWKKNQPGLRYQWVRRYCEFIIFISNRQKAKHEDSEFDFWDIPTDPKNEYKHGTQKPVKLPLRAINFSSVSGDVVVDWFGGSGSTLIACEASGRINRTMELDEHYIDVILRRYHNLYPNKKIECLNRKLDFKKLFNN